MASAFSDLYSPAVEGFAVVMCGGQDELEGNLPEIIGVQRDEPDDADVGLVLPCSVEQFGAFVSKLLGRPQVINGSIPGSFTVAQADIASFDGLIKQRIAQQNDSQLLQQTIRISFDNGSSVELTTLADFLAYNEVRPLVVTGVHMTWTLLVKFHDRPAPERQSIDVSLSIIRGVDKVASEHVNFPCSHGHGSWTRLAPWTTGFAFYRIEHTARTWGADIDGLLKNHIESILVKPSPIARFVSEHSGKVGLGIGIVFFLVALIVGLAVNRSVEAGILTSANATVAGARPIDIIVELDALRALVANPTWARFYFLFAVFLIASAVLACALGAFVSDRAELEEPSFILLSRKSEERRVKLTKVARGKIVKFVLSLVASTAVGVASNYLFALLVRHWVSV